MFLDGAIIKEKLLPCVLTFTSNTTAVSLPSELIDLINLWNSIIVTSDYIYELLTEFNYSLFLAKGS